MSVAPFDCRLDWIAVAEAAKPALALALECCGCHWLPGSCRPRHVPQGTRVPFTSFGCSWPKWLLLHLPVRRSPFQSDSLKLLAKTK